MICAPDTPSFAEIITRCPGRSPEVVEHDNSTGEAEKTEAEARRVVTARNVVIAGKRFLSIVVIYTTYPFDCTKDKDRFDRLSTSAYQSALSESCMQYLIKSALVTFALFAGAAMAEAQQDDDADWGNEPYIPPPPQCGEIISDFRYEHETTLNSEVSLELEIPSISSYAVYGGNGLRNSQVSWAVYGADGRRIVAATFSDGIHVFDASDGSPLGVIPGVALTTDRGDAFQPPRFGMLERYLAVASDGGHHVEVWDLETVEPVLELGRFRHPQVLAAFSGDGSRLALAESGRATRVRVFDLADTQEILNQQAPVAPHLQRREDTTIGSIDLDFSGNLLAVVGGQRTSIWEVDTERALVTRGSYPQSIWFSTQANRVNVLWEEATIWNWSLNEFEQDSWGQNSFEQGATNRTPGWGTSNTRVMSVSREQTVMWRRVGEHESTLLILRTDAEWDTSLQGVPGIAAFEQPFSSGGYPRQNHNVGTHFLFTQFNDWVGLCDLESGVNLARVRLPLALSGRAFLHPTGNRFIALTEGSNGETRITEVRFSY